MYIRPMSTTSIPALQMSPTNKLVDRPGFADHLKGTVMTTNALQQRASNAQQELATGRNGNIHETVIAMNKSTVAFRMVMQVRNKMVTAYQEIMRMTV